MKKSATPAVLLSLCAALMIASTPALRAETAPAAPAESLERQIEQLHGAFIEALQSRDWKMLEMAAAGFKAAGLKGKDLEIEMLRAERDAALGNSANYAFGGGSFVTRPQVISWGLTCRAKAGDTAALETLRQLGKMDPQAVKGPDQKLWRTDVVTAKAAQKAYQEYQNALDDRNNALLCLAMLKEPGVLDRSIQCLTEKVEKQQNGAFYMGGFGAGANALVEAAVAADPQEGLKKLLEILNKDDEAAGVDIKVTILQSLLSLGNKDRGAWGMAANTFSIEADIGATLPADTRAQCVKPYTALLKNWKPKEGAAFDNSINSLVNLAYFLPKDAVDADLIAALEAVKGKITGDPNAQYFKQVIDQVLAQHKPKVETNNTGAAKPKKAPDDF